MIKFETINGTLCRMVEPTPLTPDAPFPCVVRLIQDDSPMGRNNDFYATSHLLAHIEIINGLDAIHFVRWQGSKTYYSRFEIIGYPVADGSAEWRNYQLMQGKCVCCPGDSEYYQASGQGRIIGRLIENNEFNSTWNSNTFMRDDSDGWQLYEQEPLKEPDYVICKRCGGSQSVPNPVVSNTAYTTCPKCGGTGYEIKPEPAEVVLNFGNGIEGTVRSCEHDGGCVRVISGDRVIAHIMTDVLEQPTRNLVRQLLKAQEEE